MMKKTLMLLCATGLMMSMTAFAEANTDQNTELLSRIDEVNKDLDTVLEETNSVLIRHNQQQPDVEHFVYRSKDGVYIQTSSFGEALVDRGDGIYGRTSEDESDYYKMVCVTDSDYEACKAEYEVAVWYTPDLMELPAVVTEEEDQIIVTLAEQLTDEDKTRLAEENGVEEADVQGMDHRLEVDPDTLLINRIVTTLYCDSADVLMNEIEAEYGVEDPGDPEGMEEFLNAEEVRTLTLTKEPGTEEEETTSYTVRKGCGFQIMNIEYDLYSDETCTELYGGPADQTADTVLYLKKL